MTYTYTQGNVLKQKYVKMFLSIMYNNYDDCKLYISKLFYNEDFSVLQFPFCFIFFRKLSLLSKDDLEIENTIVNLCLKLLTFLSFYQYF